MLIWPNKTESIITMQLVTQIFAISEVLLTHRYQYLNSKMFYCLDPFFYAVYVDCKQFISDTSSTLQWIIINNLLHKINHHSKNHTSSLDQKSVMAKKNPRSRCRLCGSASTGLAFQILEASLLHTIPFHPLQLQPCCPNSRPQGVDDPFYDSRSLGSAISQSAVSKPIKYT